MANSADNTLVVKDAAGDYFLVPQETLEQGRASEERRTAIERLVGEADTAGFVAGGLGVAYQVVGMISTLPALNVEKIRIQAITISKTTDKSSPIP